LPNGNCPTTPFTDGGSDDDASYSGSTAEAKAAFQMGMTLTERYNPYPKGHPLYHDYGLLTELCVVDEYCNSDSSDLEPGTGVGPITLVRYGEHGHRRILFPGTNPIHVFRPERRVSINETEEGHWFHDGRVINITFEFNRKMWLFTRGVGISSDRDTRTADINFGTVLFATYHMRFRMYVDVRYNAPAAIRKALE
jgi:hypothetical protein